MTTRSTLGTENLAVAERIWAATAAGDARALEKVLAEGVVWRVHGHNPLSGVFHGRDQVIGQLAEFADRVDDLRLSLRDVYTSADGAVIHYDVWIRLGERTLEGETMIRLAVRDGRVAEADVVPIDQAGVDAFLSPLALSPGP